MILLLCPICACANKPMNIIMYIKNRKVYKGNKITSSFTSIQRPGHSAHNYYLVHTPGVLPIMAYMERLLPKGVHFSGFRYMKG